jgi:hypothetical protein
MRADVVSLVPPVIMAAIFIAVMVMVLRAQNPRSRAAARERERLAEQADPRFGEQGDDT